MRKKMLFLVNPKAGQQELRTNLMEIIDVFTAGGYDVTVHTTQGQRDLTHWIARYGGDYDRIVCAGGDGSLNEAVTGLMQGLDRPPLGYIPGGTVNDVAHTLGISREPVKAARQIIEGVPQAIDVGNFCGDRWFTYVAGFGAFTDVSYETPQAEKRILGRLAYLLNGAKTLGEIRPIPVRVMVEDQVIEDEVLLGLVCSTTSVGGFRPKNSPLKGVSLDDGLSEVILVKKIASVQDLNGIATLLTKREFDPKYFYSFQTNHIRFEFPHEVKWTLDGEFGGALRSVEIRNVHKAVEIMVPRKTEEAEPKGRI